MDFDSVSVLSGGKSVLMTAEEFLSLPGNDRANLIAAGQVEFIKEGRIVSNAEMLERARNECKSSYLVVMNGSDATGKRIYLTSNTTSLSKTGKQAGSISVTPEGYLLKRTAGASALLLNGKIVPADGTLLKQGDLVEVEGTRLQFFA